MFRISIHLPVSKLSLFFIHVQKLYSLTRVQTISLLYPCSEALFTYPCPNYLSSLPMFRSSIHLPVSKLSLFLTYVQTPIHLPVSKLSLFLTYVQIFYSLTRVQTISLLDLCSDSLFVAHTFCSLTMFRLRARLLMFMQTLCSQTRANSLYSPTCSRTPTSTPQTSVHAQYSLTYGSASVTCVMTLRGWWAVSDRNRNSDCDSEGCSGSINTQCCNNLSLNIQTTRRPYLANCWVNLRKHKTVA